MKTRKWSSFVITSLITAVPVTGVYGANYALSFNGTSSYVTFGQAPGLGVTNFTIEAWFYQESGGAATSTGAGGITAIPIVTKGRAEDDTAERNMNFFLGINTSGGNRLAVDFENAANGGNHNFTHTTTVTLDTWHHAAATYDGDRWRLYLDGVEQVQGISVGQTPRWDSLQHAALGTALTSPLASPPVEAAGFFKGRIDEVRIWNYARTATQIANNRFIEIATAPGLIARWGLNEGLGSTAGDSTGRGNIGNFVSGPTWVTGAPLTDLAPNAPTIVSPADGATGVAASSTLTANVSDPESSSMTVSFYGRKVPEDFVIIALPDTQYYCDYTKSLSSYFYNQADWIVANRQASNIAYVAHLGDCVEHGDYVNAQNQPVEWQVAANAMYRLEDPLTTFLQHGIPYGIAVGNHDMGSGGGSGTTAKYNEFFGEAHFAPHSVVPNGGYYGGHYGSDNDNHYDLFSAGSMDFIVIYFKWDSADPGPEAAVLTWANTLLQTYSNRRAIVVSHFILEHGNPALFGNEVPYQGRTIYNALRGNPNFHFMLCGHRTSEGQRIIGVSGSKVIGMMSDYQASDPNGGNGYLRVLLFSPSRNKIFVKTYSPSTAGYRSGAGSTFELDYDMQDGYTAIGNNTGVASGANTSKSWPGLLSATKYEWYVTADDGTTTVKGPVSTFTTTQPISAQPQHKIVSAGQNAVFTVSVSGTGPFTYQWRKNGVNLSNGGNISGATTASLTVSSTSASDAASYTVLVNETGGGQFLSAGAQLSVVTQGPVSQQVNPGSTVQFSVTIAGTTPSFTYQWKKNNIANNLVDGGNISGAQTPTVQIANVSSSDVAAYRVYVTNAPAFWFNSPSVNLTLNVPVTITSQPRSMTANPGNSVTFTVAASGTTPYTYQWRKNGVNLSNGGNVSGATTASLTLTSLSTSDAGNYSVVVANVVGPVTSSDATLTIISAPVWGLVSSSLGASSLGNILTHYEQSDGKILVGGDFGVVRLQANGTLDTGFSCPISGSVYAFAVAADGKIYAGGFFSATGGAENLVRLNSGGSVDNTWGWPQPNDAVYALALQPDGSLVVGGSFTTVEGDVYVNRLTRLNGSGWWDGDFHAHNRGVDAAVRAITLQSDGKIVAAGEFSYFDDEYYSGITQTRLLRLNSDGTLDSHYYIYWITAGNGYAVRVQSDGKVLLAGTLAQNTYPGIYNGICRFTTDIYDNAVPDTAFNVGAGANASINAMILDTAGKIYVAGGFTSMDTVTRGGIARLNTDGSVDANLNPGSGIGGTSPAIYAISRSSDGTYIISGNFTSYNGTTRYGIARLNAP